MAIERVKTGIKGLDEALNGGIPAGNLVLVSGGAGTGKSTFCMQFLVNGAKNKEKGLYLSTEQTEEDLRKQALEFGWKVFELEERGLLKIVFVDIVKENRFLEKVQESIANFQPQRLVVDSMSTLADYSAITSFSRHPSILEIQQKVLPTMFSENLITKRILIGLINELKKSKATVMVTSELPEETPNLSADGISEFITDGVILLKSLAMGNNLNRTIEVKKMRYTNIDGGIHAYEITNKGIVIELNIK